MVSIEAIYSQPTYSGGGGIPFFAGSRRQFGGGIFGSLARLVLPTAKRALKTIGKSALSVGKNVAADVLRGRNITDALIDHSKQEALTQLENHLGTESPPPPPAPRAAAARTPRKAGNRKRKSTGIKQNHTAPKKAYF